MLKLGDSTANDRNVNTTRIGSSGCGRGSGCDGRNSRGGRSSDGRRRRPVPDSPKQSEQKMAGKRYRSEMDCMDNQDGNDCTQQKQRIDGNQAEVEAGVATPANKRMRKSLLGTVMSLIGHSIRLFTPGRARVSATPSRSPTGGAGSPEQTHDAMVTAISDGDSPGEVVFNSPGSDLSLLPTAVTARSGSHGPEHFPSKPPGGRIENGDDARGAVTRPVVVSPGALHDLAGASPSVSSLLSGRANPSELGFISRSPRPASDSNSKRVVPILAPVAPRTSMGAKMVRVGLRKSGGSLRRERRRMLVRFGVCCYPADSEAQAMCERQWDAWTMMWTFFILPGEQNWRKSASPEKGSLKNYPNFTLQVPERSHYIAYCRLLRGVIPVP
ncbi:unnamed protein product [Ascophyllum nodosum]